jgi:hypothetical protein
MSKFGDFNFGDDADIGPDTDPTPDDPNNVSGTDNIPNDRNNFDEPGEGDSFRGEDVSVWDASGNPEEPGAQTDQAHAPIEMDSQSAVVPDGGGSVGRNDDSDAQENKGDEQTGDKEDDTPKPEETISIVEDEPPDHYDETSYYDDSEPEQKFDHPTGEYKYYDDTVPADDEVTWEYLNPNVDPEALESFLADLEVEVNELENILNIDLDLEDAPDLPGELSIDISDDEYEMPGLDEIHGSLDINDYIGDVSLNSLIEEFQFLDDDLDSELEDF